MTDFTRRTLRTWAVLDALYALLVAGLVIGVVPWKTPFANIVLLAYAAFFAAAVPGLWRGTRLGHRLALMAALLGLVIGVILVAGLLGSWAYLRAVYGEFGYGGALVCLVLAALAFQVTGLFPAIQLRALLRREVRADLGPGPFFGRALLGLALLPPLVALHATVRYGMNPIAPVGEEGRTQAVAFLRAVLDGREPAPMPALRGVPVGEGPLLVTLWQEARIVHRVAVQGADLAQAVEAAARALTRQPSRDPAKRRIKIDRIVARAPVLDESLPVVAMSVSPGLDGLHRMGTSDDARLLPDDLVRAQLFGAAALVPGIQEMRLGLDAAAALKRLPAGEEGLERFRTESWVEGPEGAALPAIRGNTPGPEPGAAAWRAAGISGGDFILRQIQADGRFHYRYLAADDTHPRDKGYSLPRHAGTIYSLALLFGLTGEARFKDGAERAMAWLIAQIPDDCGGADRACVAQGRKADLGSAALALVGMLEYQRRTGDGRYAPVARRLATFILSLQKGDGDFFHAYDVPTRAVDTRVKSMFYSEEAALALVMAHEVLADSPERDAWLQAAERALDWLTGPKYDFFIGRFIYGADHWTCIAADEAHPRLAKPVYLEFCKGYAEFLRDIQYRPGDWENADYTGHYGFTSLLVPQAPAAAGFSEAIISTFELSRKHGTPDEALREQAAIALDALARDQLRAENAWLVKNPAAAAGGIRRSLVESEVRIDFTQHAASALIRGSKM